MEYTYKHAYVMTGDANVLATLLFLILLVDLALVAVWLWQHITKK
jgi:hypothetical protein